MKIVPGNQRIHDQKGAESTERHAMWRSEESPRNQAHDWRRPVATCSVVHVEDLDIECERWDGLS